MNSFCRLDYDFLWCHQIFYFPDAAWIFLPSLMVIEPLALSGFVSHKVTLCRGKLKQHDNHEFFDWLPTFLPSTESLRMGRTKRYVPDGNLIYGSIPLSFGTYRVNTILCLGRLAFMSILWSFPHEVSLPCQIFRVPRRLGSFSVLSNTKWIGGSIYIETDNNMITLIDWLCKKNSR